MSFWSYQPYVSVAERRAKAAKEVAKLKKQGGAVSPVVVEGRKIAKLFWGKAWCDNLERYSDFANRLPRGRSYVCNGLVIDLQIARGKVEALVSGSEIYKVKIEVALAAPARWKAICGDCAGSVGSLVELLAGKLSSHVMERVCRAADGLFPAPKEIKLSCSCPDWADMCKHVAATLYGVGARLDAEPELIFTLRGVERGELVSAGADLALVDMAAGGERVLADDDLSALFGVEIEAPAKAARETKPSPTSAKGKGASSTRSAAGTAKKRAPRSAAPVDEAPKRAASKRRADAGARAKREPAVSLKRSAGAAASVPAKSATPSHLDTDPRGGRKKGGQSTAAPRKERTRATPAKPGERRSPRRQRRNPPPHP